jgi:hypothetical protein
MAALAGSDAAEVDPVGVSVEALEGVGLLATDAADGSDGSEAGADGNAADAALAGRTIAVAGTESGVCLLQATSEAKETAATPTIQCAFMPPPQRHFRAWRISLASAPWRSNRQRPAARVRQARRAW